MVILLLVAVAVTVVAATATTPMEETTTQATTVATAALLPATMAMVAKGATLLVVSLLTVHCYSYRFEMLPRDSAIAECNCRATLADILQSFSG